MENKKPSLVEFFEYMKKRGITQFGNKNNLSKYYAEYLDSIR